MEPRFAAIQSAFPHAFSLFAYEGWDPANRQRDFVRVCDWCREHFGGPAMYWWGNRWHFTQYSISFRNHADAMHFKLRWS